MINVKLVAPPLNWCKHKAQTHLNLILKTKPEAYIHKEMVGKSFFIEHLLFFLSQTHTVSLKDIQNKVQR